MARFLTAIVLALTAVQASAELSGQIDAIRRAHEIAAVSLVLVTRRGIERELSLGVVDHDSREPMTTSHYVRIGSISKMFLGLAALQLQAEGRIDLTQPVKVRLDPLPYDNPWHETHPVTLAQLLEHTSGLTDMTKKEWDFNKAASIEKAFSVDPSSRRLNWPPGLHSSYSNSGAGIAAWVMEKITHQPFELVVSEKVFVPLALTSATYALTPEVKRSLITGYDRDGVSKIPYWNMLYAAFGGVNIRVADMSRVLIMLLNAGRLDGETVFTPAQISRLSTATTTLAARTGLRYGYGLGLYHFTHKGVPFIGHGGDADGYLSYLAYSPYIGRGYFVAINAFNNPALRQVRRVIEEHLVAGVEHHEPAVFDLPLERINAITGRYRQVTRRFPGGNRSGTIEISHRDGELFTRAGDRTGKLIPVTSHHFRRSGEPYATSTIVEYEGRQWFQADEGNFELIYQ